MATKVTLNTLASLANETTHLTELNQNFTTIADQIDLLVSRDGESPNTMTAALDMNSQQLLNLIDASTSQEPVTKSQLDAASDLTSSNANTTNYTATGAGAVERTVQARLDEFTNVKDFEAIGDGVTDDQAAFVSADTVGFFVVPAGTYSIQSNLSIANDVFFLPGAILKPSSGVVITFTGSIDAGLWQTFDTSLGGSFLGSEKIKDIYPEWFGAVGDAKEWNTSTLTWDINVAPTDDTVALNAAWAMSAFNKLTLSRFYGVYPQTSGIQKDQTDTASVEDGTIVPLLTYVVKATSGSVTYDSIAYTNGQTFVGQTNKTGFTTSGDALPYFSFKIAVFMDFSNMAPASHVTVEGPGGLVSYEAGVALAVLGAFDGNSPDYLAYNVKISADLEAHTSTYGTATIGYYASATVFNSSVPKLNTVGCHVGAIMNSCWNVAYGQLSFGGANNAYAGLMALNANSASLEHIFTNNFKMGGYVKFISAHGASVDDTFTVSFKAAVEFTGTITEIISSTEVLAETMTRTASTTLSLWTGKINAGSAINILDARPVGGIGCLMTGADGVKLYADFQHKGEAGLKYIHTGGAGNIGLIIDGHIEGPASGVWVERGPNISSGELQGLSLRCNVYAGRSGSSSDFGHYHGHYLDYVRDAKIHPCFIQSREFQQDSAFVTAWAASTAYSLDDVVQFRGMFYLCTTAGTSDSGLVGPVGTGAGISDGTAAWDFLHYGSTCITITENCSDVSRSSFKKDHNHGSSVIIDRQPRGTVTDGQFYMLDALSGTEIISLTGKTADGGFNDVLVGSPTPVRSSSGDNSDPGIPKAILVNIELTVNTVGTSGRVALVLNNDTLHGNNDQSTRVPFESASSGDLFTWQRWIPLTNYGQFKYQSLITASVSWNVDWSVRAIGFIL